MTSSESEALFKTGGPAQKYNVPEKSIVKV